MQACVGLMKIAQMRAELPSHILEEREEKTLASERKNLENMTAEELAKEYKALIEGLA
jgi:hypothetical protein